MDAERVKKIFTGGNPASQFSAIIDVEMPWAIKNAASNPHGARILAAAMNLAAGDTIGDAQPPSGRGKDTEEVIAAMLLWSWAADVPYNYIRRTSYAAGDKDNQSLAVTFWRMALEQGYRDLPVDGEYDFIAWVGEPNMMVKQEMLHNFQNRYDSRKSTGNQPIENRGRRFLSYASIMRELTSGHIENCVKWRSPTEMMLYTGWGLPAGMENLPGWNEAEQQRTYDYQTSITLSDDGALDISIITVNNKAMKPTGQYLAVGLAQFIVGGSHQRIRVKHDEGAALAADFLMAALTIYDNSRPEKTNGVCERKDSPTTLTGVFIGLAEAHVSENFEYVTPNVKSPVMQNARVELNEDGAKAIRRYLQYGSIRDDEKTPEGLRLAGVKTEGAAK